MKKVFFILLLFSFYSLHAQEIGKINIGIVIPEQIENLDSLQIGKLRTKLEHICTQNGISSGFTLEGFLLYPDFEFYVDELVESGMQMIYSVKVELNLFLKQIDGVTVASVSKTYEGSGNSRNKAVINAISHISPSDTLYTQFIIAGKRKILEYYNTQCDRIMAKSIAMRQKGQYEEAIALLLSIPEESPCYKKILDLTIEIYNSMIDNQCDSILRDVKIGKYSQDYETAISLLYKISPNASCYNELEPLLQDIINSQCNQILHSAKALAANQKYEEAARLLATLNPKADCYEEVQKFMKEIEIKYEKITQRNWNFKIEQQKDTIQLQKQSINAAKEVAKAFYSH